MALQTIPLCTAEGIVTLSHATDVRWRQEYRAQRYMRWLTEPELRQRYCDIFRNFMTINAAGLTSPLPTQHPWHGYWRLRFNQIVAEYEIRFGPYPGGMDTHNGDDMYFPRTDSKRIVEGRAAVQGRAFVQGKHFFKFGERTHIEAMLRHGALRIASASSFADDAFNKAIRDNELEMDRWMHTPTPKDLEPLAHLPGWIDGEDGPVVVTRGTKDFWMFCLSATYDAAMYDDFDCDACLVVHDAQRFFEKLLTNVARQLDTAQHAMNRVVYVDPMTQFEDEIPVAFQKHARHAYQDEVRAVWIPKGSRVDLTPRILEIGSLESIAELIMLNAR